MLEAKFKHTEIGLIPHDWEVKNIKNCFDFKQGVQCAVYLQSLQPFDGSVRFIRIVDLTQPDELPRYIADPGLVHHVKKDDLFMVRYGSPGLVGYGFEGVIANNLFRLLPRIEICSKFYKYILTDLHDEILALSSSTTMPAVNFTALSTLQIPLPPTTAEQERIADALSTIDNLITDLDTLIEKKRAIKTGTMQQLLTGKKRLKGYSEPWVEKTMGEIGYTYSGLAGKESSDFGEGNAQYITFLNILNNPIIDTTIFEKVKVTPTERQNKVNRNDIFFNTSSETPEDVGICAVLDKDIDDLYLNSFCFGFRITDESMSGKYLAYFWRSKQGRDIMTALAQGATRYNLSKIYFNAAKLIVPPSLEEQIAIINVLSFMDTEIAALEQKRDKYTAIKQGMMQTLLTGKIRLM